MLRYDMLNATGILSVVGPVDSPRMLTLGWGAEGGGGEEAVFTQPACSCLAQRQSLYFTAHHSPLSCMSCADVRDTAQTSVQMYSASTREHSGFQLLFWIQRHPVCLERFPFQHET